MNITEKLQELKLALMAIIEECPEPKLPYGRKVVELAQTALNKVDEDDD